MASDILQRLTGISGSGGTGTDAAAVSVPGGLASAAASPTPAGAVPEVCKRAYLRAAVRVLERNTPGLLHQSAQVSSFNASSSSVTGEGGGNRNGSGSRLLRDALPPAPLAEMSVRLLLKELNDIVDPPRRLPRFKVHLRRAPTQEVSILLSPTTVIHASVGGLVIVLEILVEDFRIGHLRFIVDFSAASDPLQVVAYSLYSQYR